MTTRSIGILLLLVTIVPGGAVLADDWPQFRGPNATGRGVGKQAFPTAIGPNDRVAWKTPLPPGHSSPVVVGDRIFLQAIEGERLLTIALDRKTGRELWRQPAPYAKLEAVHRVGSLAQNTPASDGKIVVVFFGSCGMFAYDAVTGREAWRVPMGPFKNDFGSGSSPILHDGKVVLAQDHDLESFVAVYDARTGRQIWRVERPEASRNFSTPLIWKNQGREEIVVCGTLQAKGYDFATGAEVWSSSGLARQVCCTAALDEKGNLFAAGWSAGGDPADLIRLEPFDDIIEALDVDKNGTLEEPELPDSAVKTRFTTCDRDKDGSLTREEYERLRMLFDRSENALLAFRPGLRGDVSETGVAWRNKKDVPFCSSPLATGDLVFVMKDEGVLISLDAKRGTALKAGRVFGTDSYYASPVAGDGKLYVVSEEGKLTVATAERDWKILHKAEFGEGVYATPALVDGRVYLRTVGALYCFE